MTQKISAYKIKQVSKTIRDAHYGSDTEFNPMEHPFALSATYFPGDIPTAHWLTDHHDRRAYSRAAIDGWWEISIYDVDEAHMPIARSAFSERKGRVIAERLAVDRQYRGNQLGKQMIDLGGRLWGGTVEGSDEFIDEFEACWNSPSVDVPE